MIATNTPISQIDQDTNQRQILAKIYKLLIRLAEESQAQLLSGEITAEEKQETNVLPDLTSTPSNKEDVLS
jgi:hypothetical protein